MSTTDEPTITEPTITELRGTISSLEDQLIEQEGELADANERAEEAEARATLADDLAALVCELSGHAATTGRYPNCTHYDCRERQRILAGDSYPTLASAPVLPMRGAA